MSTQDTIYSTGKYQTPAHVHPSATQGIVSPKAHTAVIILAGGTGERFGRVGGKQLVVVEGHPILSWTIAAFDAVADVAQIVVVCPEVRHEEFLKNAIDPYDFKTTIVLASAGTTRQESAFSGMQAVAENASLVALHDGARPLVTPLLIEHVINSLKGNFDADGAIVATPAIDTLKVVQNGKIVGTPDRSVFYNAQTPQVFRKEIYARAQASALKDGFLATDDAALIERMGGTVLVVEGSRDNIKLTVPEDYDVVSAVIQRTLFDAKIKE